MKLLVHCILKFDPAKRDEAIISAAPLIKMASEEPGCLAYTWGVDLMAEDTVHVYEEWLDQASLESHFTAPSYYKMSDHLSANGLQGAVARKFLAAKEAPIYVGGGPTADFDKKDS